MTTKLAQFDGLPQDVRKKIWWMGITSTESLLHYTAWPSMREQLLKALKGWNIGETELRPWIIAADLRRIDGVPLNVIQELAKLQYIENVQSFAQQDAARIVSDIGYLKYSQSEQEAIAQMTSWIGQAKLLPATVIWDLAKIDDFENIYDGFTELRQRTYSLLLRIFFGYQILGALTVLFGGAFLAVSIFILFKNEISTIGPTNYWIWMLLLFFMLSDTLILFPLSVLAPFFVQARLSRTFDTFMKKRLLSNLEVKKQLTNYMVLATHQKLNYFVVIVLFIVLCFGLMFVANIFVGLTQDLLYLDPERIFEKMATIIANINTFLYGALSVMLLILAVVVLIQWKNLRPTTVVQKKAFSILMANRLAETLTNLIYIGLVFLMFFISKHIHDRWLNWAAVPLFNLFFQGFPPYALANLGSVLSNFMSNLMDLVFPTIYKFLGLFMIGFSLIYIVLPSMLVKNFKNVIISVILILGAWLIDNYYSGVGTTLGIASGTLLYLLVAGSLIFINNLTFKIVEDFMEDYKDCGKCGLRNSGGANFCSNCGSQLK